MAWTQDANILATEKLAESLNKNAFIALRLGLFRLGKGKYDFLEIGKEQCGRELMVNQLVLNA